MNIFKINENNKLFYSQHNAKMEMRRHFRFHAWIANDIYLKLIQDPFIFIELLYSDK